VEATSSSSPVHELPGPASIEARDRNELIAMIEGARSHLGPIGSTWRPTTATTARRQGSQLAWKKSANSVCSSLTTL